MATAPAGRRSGNVQAEYYSQEEYLASLDRLVTRLNEQLQTSGGTFKFDRKGLALLVSGLMQFMEDALGLNVSSALQLTMRALRAGARPRWGRRTCRWPSRASCPPGCALSWALRSAPHLQAMYKSHPKLPARLLRDVSPDGPLAVVASLAAEVIKAKGLKRIDWLNPALRKEVGQPPAAPAPASQGASQPASQPAARHLGAHP